MRLTRVLWPIIIICSALAALMAMLVFPGIMVRPPLIMLFLFVCPGMALVRFLHLKDLVDKFALALALSFSIDGIVAGIYLYAGHWSPSDILITLAATSIVAVVIELTNAHVFVYKHVGLVRSLGALLTHPVIVGTRSAVDPHLGNLSEEATVRLVTVQSLSNLLNTSEAEDIEEKATMQLAKSHFSSVAQERFEKPVGIPSLQNIAEKPTEQLANVSANIAEKPTEQLANAPKTHLSSAARERFEQQETVEMSTPQSLSPSWSHVNEDARRPQQKSPVPEERQRREEALTKAEIEEKDTVEMARASAVPQAAVEDAEKTVRVSGPQWMQKQLKITNGGFPEDDIEKVPTRHITNADVSPNKRTGTGDPERQRRVEERPHTNTPPAATQSPATPRPKVQSAVPPRPAVQPPATQPAVPPRLTAQSPATERPKVQSVVPPRPATEQPKIPSPITPQPDTDVDDPNTQRVSRDTFRTNSEPLDNQTEERSPAFPNNRPSHKKRLAPKFTRIEN